MAEDAKKKLLEQIEKMRAAQEAAKKAAAEGENPPPSEGRPSTSS